MVYSGGGGKKRVIPLLTRDWCGEGRSWGHTGQQALLARDPPQETVGIMPQVVHWGDICPAWPRAQGNPKGGSSYVPMSSTGVGLVGGAW